MRVDSVLDLIGNTPLVDASRLSPNPAVRIFAKLEGNNPGGCGPIHPWPAGVWRSPAVRASESG